MGIILELILSIILLPAALLAIAVIIIMVGSMISGDLRKEKDNEKD